MDMNTASVKIEAHVPFRFRVLLKAKERGQLDQAITRYTMGGAKVVALLESTITAKRRIVRGSVFEGTFEYKDIDGEEGNIDVGDLLKSEFPGYSYDEGGVDVDDMKAVQFVLTGNFSVVLLRHKAHSRLLVRTGVVEIIFDGPASVKSISDAILCAENDKTAAAFLAPVSEEIVHCEMLGG